MGGKLEGLSFCFIGKIKTMRRAEAEQMVRDHGGEPKSGVVKDLSYLVTNSTEPTAKYNKAQGQGTEIITEDEFLSMIKISRTKARQQTRYKRSYQRFLRTKAWQQTKNIVLGKRRKKWDKKGFSIGTHQFRCDKCKNIYYLSFANYHHKNLDRNKGYGWCTPSNVTIICRNCHEHYVVGRNLKKKD